MESLLPYAAYISDFSHFFQDPNNLIFFSYFLVIQSVFGNKMDIVALSMHLAQMTIHIRYLISMQRKLSKMKLALRTMLELMVRK